MANNLCETCVNTECGNITYIRNGLYEDDIAEYFHTRLEPEVIDFTFEVSVESCDGYKIQG